jgi:hypothetical protein
VVNLAAREWQLSRSGRHFGTIVLADAEIVR